MRCHCRDLASRAETRNRKEKKIIRRVVRQVQFDCQEGKRRVGSNECAAMRGAVDDRRSSESATGAAAAEVLEVLKLRTTKRKKGAASAPTPRSSPNSQGLAKVQYNFQKGSGVVTVPGVQNSNRASRRDTRRLKQTPVWSKARGLSRRRPSKRRHWRAAASSASATVLQRTACRETWESSKGVPLSINLARSSTGRGGSSGNSTGQGAEIVPTP